MNVASNLCPKNSVQFNVLDKWVRNILVQVTGRPLRLKIEKYERMEIGQEK